MSTDIIVLFLSLFILGSHGKLQCSLSQSLKDEIQSYQPTVNRIIDAIYNGPYKGVLYSDLADFADDFGHRHAGSESLEIAIDDLIQRQEAAGLVVSSHSVAVPRWERGEASAEILTPRRQKLHILTLGSSISTPEDGITAEVVVVKDFSELEARKNEIPGKIVVYAPDWVSYGETGIYRGYGPERASLLGAVAALVRSLTPFSLDSPHTGGTIFSDEANRIPCASITVENANMLYRLSRAGENITIHFRSTAKNFNATTSRNLIGDIVGASKPEEYVIISGHIDSWDVGQGVVDDAGGSFLAWHSLALIKSLGLEPPARTLRAIMWTAEEPGLFGADAYRRDREDEARNWTVAFESDVGVFESRGIGFCGTDEAACILQEIASLFSSVNGTEILQQEGAGSDVMSFLDLEVPIGEPLLKPNNYFWYHHSDADWIDGEKTEDLDQNLAIFASTVYVLGNLSVTLPKGPCSSGLH